MRAYKSNNFFSERTKYFLFNLIEILKIYKTFYKVKFKNIIHETCVYDVFTFHFYPYFDASKEIMHNRYLTMPSFYFIETCYINLYFTSISFNAIDTVNFFMKNQ